MSPDTKLILDRLEKEGKLLRTDDRTYNIKKVIAANEKTAEAVAALKSSMGATTEVIQKQTRLAELQDERAFKLEKLNSEEQEEYRQREKEQIIKQSQLDTKKLKLEEKKLDQQEKRDFKIFGKDGILVSTLKSTFNFAKQIAMFVALGAVGYELIAGILEASFPDTFGPEGSLGDIPSVFEIFGSVADVFKSTDLVQLKANLGALANPALLTTLGLTAAGGKLISVGTDALTYAALIKLITPEGGTIATAAGKAGGLAVKGGIAALLVAALNLAWKPMENYIRKNLMGMSEDDIAELDGTTTGFTVAKYSAMGAITLGTMFGPTGALVGAIGGFLIGMGALGLQYLRNRRTEAEKAFAQDYQDSLEVINKGLEGEKLSEEEVASLEKLAKQGLKRLNQTTNDVVAKQLQDNLQTINNVLLDNLESRELAKIFGYNIESLGTDKFVGVENEAIRQLVEEKNEEGITKLLDFYQNQGGLSAENAVRRLTGGALGRYFERDNQFGVNEARGEIPLGEREGIRQALVDAIEEIAPGMRTGSGGFKNFGDGTLAMLHGEEAVVTKNSIEGQILENLRSGKTLNTQTSRIAEALAAGSMMSPGTTIVNTVDNSAPISIQQSKGGDKIANTRIGGGMGGGSYVDMPGLVS